jgi:hypothetical protein
MRSIRFMSATALAVAIGFVFNSSQSLGQEHFFDFPLAINGQTVEEFLANRDQAEQLLNGLMEIDVVEQRAQGISLLERIDQGIATQEEVPDALTGIGGFGTLLAARAYFFDEAHRVQGRIRDYVYVEDAQSGHLAVDVRTEFFASAKDRDSGGLPTRTELLHWDIDVEGVYEIHHRGLDFTNPFPQVDLALPGYAIAAIWARDLKYKLHARGPGIVVRHVYRKIDEDPIARLPSTDPRYASTDASCIDLLFNPYPPETELPPQIGYCLGRCEHPPIVNTGGGSYEEHGEYVDWHQSAPD